MSGWRLFAELGGFGLILALYALRPVLSVSSLDSSDLHATNGAKVLITNSGMRISNVKVQCVTNKVVFKDLHTLSFDRFAVINEYSVPDVGTGESFTGDCNFAWSMWTKPTEGFFLLGGGTASAPQLGITFLLNNGNASFPPGVASPAMIRPDFTGYAYNQVTAIDASFIVLYTWPVSLSRRTRIIHMIAQRANGDIKWRVAPESEPVIPGARPSPDGLTFSARGTTAGAWGIEMVRTAPP